MKIFKLPDLGEGLPNAIIREWYFKVGDRIKNDAPMVSMETAKALVEVPAPFDGTIAKLFGNINDTIDTGQALVGFEGEAEEEVHRNSGTVVGSIEESSTVLSEQATGLTIQKTTYSTKIKATPAIRALAKRLGVDIKKIKPKGERISAREVNAAARELTSAFSSIPEGMESLTPVRKAMSIRMSDSHQNVVPVTLSDEVNIFPWKGKENITFRLIRALQIGCRAEPILNATFNGEHMAYRYNEKINLGLAVDTAYGLYVPVLKDIASQDDASLCKKINLFKKQAQDKSISQDDLDGATIILSNFGTLAGRYANPIVVPPMTSIIGAGRLYEGVVGINGQPALRPLLPLSVTADHRLVTGGEIARFLKAMMDALSKA